MHIELVSICNAIIVSLTCLLTWLCAFQAFEFLSLTSFLVFEATYERFPWLMAYEHWQGLEWPHLIIDLRMNCTIRPSSQDLNLENVLALLCGIYSGWQASFDWRRLLPNYRPWITFTCMYILHAISRIHHLICMQGRPMISFTKQFFVWKWPVILTIVLHAAPESFAQPTSSTPTSDLDNSIRVVQQGTIKWRAEFRASGSVDLIDVATLKNTFVSGSSYTVTLGESPSSKMATSYNSDMLPDTPLLGLKSNLHQPPSVQMTDKLFDSNLQPLASKLTMGTVSSDSPSTPSFDLLYDILEQLSSRHVGESDSDQFLGPTQSAELGKTFDSNRDLPAYSFPNATSQLQQAPIQDPDDPESFMKAIASIGESRTWADSIPRSSASALTLKSSSLEANRGACMQSVIVSWNKLHAYDEVSLK